MNRNSGTTTSAAQKVMQEINRRKTWVDGWRSLHRKLTDAQTLLELAVESSDTSFEAELRSETATIEQGLGDLEFRNMLSGEDDAKNCILTIHAGAGGTEAQDWAEMLMRMYLRWAEKKGFKTFLVDELAAKALVSRARQSRFRECTPTAIKSGEWRSPARAYLPV